MILLYISESPQISGKEGLQFQMELSTMAAREKQDVIQQIKNIIL
jgi:hypothetical protein